MEMQKEDKFFVGLEDTVTEAVDENLSDLMTKPDVRTMDKALLKKLKKMGLISVGERIGNGPQFKLSQHKNKIVARRKAQKKLNQARRRKERAKL